MGRIIAGAETKRTVLYLSYPGQHSERYQYRETTAGEGQSSSEQTRQADDHAVSVEFQKRQANFLGSTFQGTTFES